MAFFNDIGKKAKGMADVAKINSSISAEEKNISNLFNALGMKYFELHKDDCEESLSGFVASIKAAEQNIKNYQTQVYAIKGVKRCTKCGAEVAANVAFCNVCGEKLEIPEYANICKNCGAPLENGAKFCMTCGTATVPAQPTPVPTPAPQPAPAPQAAPAPTPAPAPAPQAAPDFSAFKQPEAKTCTNCGAAIEEGMAFCTECGMRVEAETAPVEETPVQPATKKCPTCGTELDNDMLFCTECGTKL